MTAYLLETLAMLAVVCALAFGVLAAARRLGIGRPNGPIQLAGHLPLDARRGRSIYLVRVGTQVLVVGASEAGLTKIGEMPATELPQAEAEPPPTLSFGEHLLRFGKRAR
jgi:flagellar biogenesis protein FliO